MNRTLLMLALSTLIVSGPAFAQQSEPSQPASAQSAPKEGSVNDRRQDQQQRIGNGVQSGQLTAGETKSLEGREANVNREIHADRTANGGTFTQQERRQVNHQQNNLSKSIYADKHNANQAHFGNNEVGQRRENQQDRIANGIKSGSMTAGENSSHREPRTGDQPASTRRPRRGWRKTHRPGTPQHQPATEWRQPRDLPSEAQRR